jgi:hypothetical protein
MSLTPAPQAGQRQHDGQHDRCRDPEVESDVAARALVLDVAGQQGIDRRLLALVGGALAGEVGQRRQRQQDHDGDAEDRAHN